MRIARALALGLALLLAAGAAAGADAALRARAEAGDPGAQFELGRRYSLGGPDLPKDEREALRWFRLAAEQGDARAQTNLAGIYEEGRGVERDEAEAINWLVKAADQGHPRAMFLLGERFEQGRGVPQSKLLAHMWMQRAARAGSPAAQFRVRDLERSLDASERDASARLDALQRQRLHTASQPDAGSD